jgi:hypothetical protein
VRDRGRELSEGHQPADVCEFRLRLLQCFLGACPWR